MKVKNIDTTSIEGKIKVMQAFAAGAKIACCGTRPGDLDWRVATTPTWDWCSYSYDIIAEPEVVYITKYSDGSASVYDTYTAAMHYVKQIPNGVKSPIYVGKKFVEAEE